MLVAKSIPCLVFFEFSFYYFINFVNFYGWFYAKKFSFHMVHFYFYFIHFCKFAKTWEEHQEDQRWCLFHLSQMIFPSLPKSDKSVPYWRPLVYSGWLLWRILFRFCKTCIGFSFVSLPAFRISYIFFLYDRTENKNLKTNLRIPMSRNLRNPDCSCLIVCNLGFAETVISRFVVKFELLNQKKPY